MYATDGVVAGSDFQHHIRKKFLPGMREPCAAAVFFCDGGDGEQADSVPAMLGGKVGVVGFSGVSVEAVCRDDVQY